MASVWSGWWLFGLALEFFPGAKKVFLQQVLNSVGIMSVEVVNKIFAALFKNLMLDGGNPALVVVLVEGRSPSSSGTPPCY